MPSHPTVSPTLPCLSGFLLSAVSPASHLSVDAGLPWSTVSVLPCPDLRTCLNLCTLPALPVANPEFSPLASCGPSAAQCFWAALLVSSSGCLAASRCLCPCRCCPAAFAGPSSHSSSLHRSQGSLFPQALDLLSASLLDL